MAERSWRNRGKGSTAVDETPAVAFQEPVEQESTTEELTEQKAQDTEAEYKAEVYSTDTIDENTEGTDNTVTDTAVVEQVTEGTDAQAASTETQATERKRAPRPAINVGNVVVRPSTRTDFTTRTTPTETNPVFLAVKGAELDVPTDVLVENDEKRIQGAISILRRAGAKLGVGMHIAPKPYPTEEVEGTEYAVLTFKTSAERQVRGKSTEVAADAS